MTDSHLQPGGGNASDMLYCQTENERIRSAAMAFQYTEEQLNKLDKEMLVQLFLGLQDQVGALTQQTKELDVNFQKIYN